MRAKKYLDVVQLANKMLQVNHQTHLNVHVMYERAMALWWQQEGKPQEQGFQQLQEEAIAGLLAALKLLQPGHPNEASKPLVVKPLAAMLLELASHTTPPLISLSSPEAAAAFRLSMELLLQMGLFCEAGRVARLALDHLQQGQDHEHDAAILCVQHTLAALDKQQEGVAAATAEADQRVQAAEAAAAEARREAEASRAGMEEATQQAHNKMLALKQAQVAQQQAAEQQQGAELAAEGQRAKAAESARSAAEADAAAARAVRMGGLWAGLWGL